MCGETSAGYRGKGVMGVVEREMLVLLLECVCVPVYMERLVPVYMEVENGVHRERCGGIRV